MGNFVLDRTDIPKPWAKPLIFRLSDSERTVLVEVDQKSAIAYSSAWRAPGLAIALAPQRTEYFLEAVEIAVNRLALSDLEEPVVLTWADLNP